MKRNACEKPLTQRSHRAHDGSGSDAVADAAHRSAGTRRWVTFEVRHDGLDIDLDLGLAGPQDGVAERRHRLRVALRLRCQAVPRPFAVIAVVADDVIAGISERPHRSLGAIIEPRAVMEEQDHRKRTIALGVHDVDPHVPVRRRHDQFPVHDLTLRWASWACLTTPYRQHSWRPTLPVVLDTRACLTPAVMGH